jgi:hypothetical protein
MAQTLRVARLYFVLLAVVVVGRLLMGAFGVPYEKGTNVFSIVVLTVFACLFYGAFCRRFCDYRLIQAALLGVTMALGGQLLILLITIVAYAAGAQTYFNHPTALGADPGTVVSFGRALAVRLGGLVGNSILGGIVAVLGWALGGFLPERPQALP